MAASFSSTSQPIFTTPIVEPSDIISELKKGIHFKFIDASWHLDPNRIGSKEFQSQRIVDSIFFDIDKVSTQSNLPHMLPTANLFASTCSSFGLKQEDNVCIYASKGSFSAPRVWWTFKCFGHKNVYLMNGGLASWIEAGGEIETSPTANDNDIPTTDYGKNVNLNENFVVDWSQVLDAASTNHSTLSTTNVLDARSAGRFHGTAPEPREGLRGGHIPGSLNLPFGVLLDGDRFKSTEEMKHIFQNIGINENSKIITTCGSGVTAVVLTLAYHQCFPDSELPRVYDGSWSEWGGREDLPLEQ